MHRRAFLQRVGAAGMALMGSGLGNILRADNVPALGRIAYQLSWIKNFQFAGEFVADYRKYFQKFGLAVDLLSGGPTMSVDPIVASGKALIGQSHPDFMANAIKHGAPLQCIGANYQKAVYCIISMAKTPLQRPEDMIGKKIGIQIGNLVIWHAFLKLNKISPDKIDTVPVQFDFAPLVTGDVDGFFGYSNDDLVQIRARGNDVHAMFFDDFGYKMFSATYSVTRDSLADKTKRAQIVAFMKGDIMGWEEAIKDPALAARLTVDVYGRANGLDLKSEEASCVATTPLMVTPDTAKHGLFWMTPSAIEETIKTLAAGGVQATPDMFTNEILEEAYAGKTTI